MWNDTLESKGRYYQSLADYKLSPGTYIILHLDGRAFSSFTRGMRRPFDNDFIEAMNETLKTLCAEVSNCKFGYTQSDEMTLVLYDWNVDKEEPSDMWLHNRICKMCSISASIASVKFYEILLKKAMESVSDVKDIPKIIKKLKNPQFDCKAWNVPSWNDAYAWLSYRNIDCIRNSITMVAQSEYSHKELLKLNSDQRKEKLQKEKGISWDLDFTDGEKYGRFCYKEEVQIPSTKSGIPTKRWKWTIHPGIPLIGTEGREKFEALNVLPKRLE